MSSNNIVYLIKFYKDGIIYIMKKRNVILGVLAIVMILITIIYLKNSPKLLGEMNYMSTEQINKTSEFSFSGEKDDTIKFSFSSNIESGDLDVILYDSKGNKVYELDRARKMQTFFTLNDSDNYTLVADCKDFTGKFSVKVFESN